MTTQLTLSRGLVAIIDDADAPLATQFKWCAYVSTRTSYAVRRAVRPDGGSTTQRLHTLLTGWRLVDHVNGDGLDNRRANLREATVVQNMRNMRKHLTGASRYKGVTWHKAGKRWVAAITVEGKAIHLGLHVDEAVAAKSYDDAARHYFGEFAALNFPRLGERSALADSGEVMETLARIARKRVA